MAITAGMPTGTGLAKFQAAFPDRMYDVGIAEQHAMTLATGLALAGMRPVRGALLDVPAARLRPDGPRRVPERRSRWSSASTAPGWWARTAPATRACSRSRRSASCRTSSIASPKDEQELRRLLRTAFGQDHPFALHYPRDPGFDLPAVEPTPIPVGAGRAAARRDGHPDRRLRARSCMRGLEVAERLAARRLVGGGHQRPLRQAARRRR